MISKRSFLIGWIFLILIVAIAFIVYFVITKRKTPADRIFLNGSVVTMTSPDSVYEAMAIRGNKIAGVGNRDFILEFLGPHTTVTDLQGQAILPGFIDAGSNFPFSAFEVLDNYVNLSGVPFVADGTNTISQILGVLQQTAQSLPTGSYVIGYAYDPNFVVDDMSKSTNTCGAFGSCRKENSQEINTQDVPLTKQLLDSVSLDNPIWVLYRDGRSGIANSLALSEANIMADTADPKGGMIFFDIGLLQGEAVEIVNRTIPVPNAEENAKVTLAAGKRYTEMGVTTALNGNANQLEIQFQNSLTRIADPSENSGENSQEPLLKNRLIFYPNVTTSERIISGVFNPRPTQDRVFIRATNFIGDGSIQYYTAFLKEPYLTNPSYSPDIDYNGFFGADLEAFRSQIFEFHQNGSQLAIYATGSATLDIVIDTLTQAQLIYPRGDARYIILNAVDLTIPQIEAFKELPVILSFFTPSLFYWGDLYATKYLGMQRTREVNPVHTAIQNGIVHTLHGNTPETPIDPLLYAWSATTRESLSQTVYGPEQTIDNYEAMRGITFNPAYANFIDHLVGTVEQNKLADLVILSKNPLEVHPSRLLEIDIIETIINGKTEFENEQYVHPSLTSQEIRDLIDTGKFPPPRDNKIPPGNTLVTVNTKENK